MSAAKTTRRTLILPLTLVLACSCAFADSVASKNRNGNRLFREGKFQEAEKAYVDAQLEAPGKPELLYNLGNALIKQKKYEPAVQSLRQAVGKAGRGLQANGWYNIGNANFEAGNLRDAAQAYIEALRINPSDREAKHNLELTLRRIQEQKQNASGKSSNEDRRAKGQGKEDSRTADNTKKDQKNESKPGAQGQQNKEQPQQQQAGAADRRDGSMSKERALQILDAMRDQELTDQRMLQEHQPRRKGSGRDW